MKPWHRLGRGEGGAGRRARRVGVLTAVVVATTVPAAYASFAASARVSTAVSTDQLAPPSGLSVSKICGQPQSISLRGATSATGAGQLVLATPSGTQAGDVLLAQVTNRGGTIPLSMPSGWNLISRDSSGTAVTSAMFWHVATAGDPTSAPFILNGSSTQMGGGIAAYAGVSAANPVDVFGVAVGTGTTATTPSLTATSPGDMLVHAVAKRQDDLPPPTGTRSLWDVMSGTSTTSAGVSAGDELLTSAGPVPVRTTSSTLSSEWIIDTVALRPLPAGQVTWTATPSDWATGYVLERSVGTSVQSTVALSSAVTSAIDGPLAIGSTYTYRLWATYRAWTSTSVAATFTVTSC